MEYTKRTNNYSRQSTEQIKVIVAGTRMKWPRCAIVIVAYEQKKTNKKIHRPTYGPGLILALCNFAVMNGFRKRRISVGYPNMGWKSSCNNSSVRVAPSRKRVVAVFIHALRNILQIVLTSLKEAQHKSTKFLSAIASRCFFPNKFCSWKKTNNSN